MNIIALFVKDCSKKTKDFRSILRIFSTVPDKCTQKTDKKREFTPIYHLPYIRPLAIINRLKLYQTALTTLGIPVVIAVYQLGYIGPAEVQIGAALGLSGCLTLYGLGYFTNKLIGIIYYNEEKDIVRLSYADFWGHRKELDLPRTDLIPVSETPRTYLDGVYLTIRRYSTKETMKLNLQYGIILDKDKLKQIL